MSVNKAIIIGNLGRDPEMRETRSGAAVCNLNVATTHAYKSKSGEKVEETEWHRVVVFGKTAEHCEKYLAKGRQVYVEGRIQTSEYEKDGVKKYSTQIIADRVQFLGGRGDSGTKSEAKDPPGADYYVPSDEGDDQIPF